MGRRKGSKNFASRLTPRTCETCRTEFSVETFRLARGGGLFCSKRCSNFARIYKSRSPEERFWEKVDRNGPEARTGLGPCWLWRGVLKPNGYGNFGRARSDTVYAHRFSFELTRSRIPAGLCVLHRCDVRSCVRPDHLFLGTQRDNAEDRDAKGRLVTPFTPGHGYSAPRKKQAP